MEYAMKKLIFIFLIGMSVSPSLAQGGNRSALSHGIQAATSPSVLNSVKQAVVAAMSHHMTESPVMTSVQINNFQNHPRVHISTTIPVPDGTLSARVLAPYELSPEIFSSSQGYVPLQFLTAEHAVYRGMKLENIEDLKNILTRGLEINKTQQLNKIYASSSLSVAIYYALPTLWNKWEGEVQTDLPVLVKIPLTSYLLAENAPDNLGLRQVFYRDIPADMIEDVMVFLEVDGKPGWYKVILNEEKLILTPVANRVCSLKVDGMQF